MTDAQLIPISHVETFVEALDKTPIEIPIETLDETQVETLDETPIEISVETLDETHIETLEETPIETVDEIPIKTIDETSKPQTLLKIQRGIKLHQR